MQHLQVLQAIETELVAADDQPPLAGVRLSITKRQAALLLAEEREPELERRIDAVRAAEAARVEARHALHHPTSEDGKVILKLNEAVVIAEGRWRFAVDRVESYEPEIRAARAVIADTALPRDLREAKRATQALLGFLVAWTDRDGRPVGQSYSPTGREDHEAVRRQVEGLKPGVVIWLGHTERELLRDLPKWIERNPRAKVRAEELVALFDFRRKLIDDRVRGLQHAARQAAAEASALVGERA